MMLRKTLIIVACVVLVGSGGWAQSSPTVTATWTAPTEGSPVVEYELRITGSDGSEFTVYTADLTYQFAPGTFEPNVEYVATVRGKDAQDRAGPWSVPSNPYVFDPGPPGACGPISWTIE